MDLRQARATLISATLISMVGAAGIALPYPVLAPYFLDGPPNSLNHFLGLDPKILLGILIALYPAGLLLGSSFIGALSDIFGRRRVLIATLSLAALGYLITVFAVRMESFLLFALARFLTGVCEGNISVARAIALDLHPVIDRTRAMSIVYASAYAGWLLGPLSGGYLMPFGMDVVFATAAVTVLLLAVFSHFTLSDEVDSQKKTSLWRALASHNSIGLLRQASLRRFMIYHLLFAFGLNCFYEFYPFWMVEAFDFGSEQIAWHTVIITAAMIASSAWLVTWFSRHFGSEATIITSVIALGACMALLPLANAMSLALLLACMGGIIAVTSGSFPPFMSQRFGHFGQGRVVGLITTSFCFANVLSAIAGSWIALLGSHWALVFGALFCLAAGAWFASLGRHSGDGEEDTAQAGEEIREQ